MGGKSCVISLPQLLSPFAISAQKRFQFPAFQLINLNFLFAIFSKSNLKLIRKILGALIIHVREHEIFRKLLSSPPF